MELSTFLYEVSSKSKTLKGQVQLTFPKENDRIEVLYWQLWQQAVYSVLVLNYNGKLHNEIKIVMQLICSYIGMTNPLIEKYLQDEVIKPNEALISKLKEELIGEIEQTIISTQNSLTSIIKNSKIVKTECESIGEYIFEIKNKILEKEEFLKDQKKRIMYLRDKSIEILEKQVIEKSNSIFEKHKFKIDKLRQKINGIDNLLKGLEECYS
jgi:hypothetical protein